MKMMIFRPMFRLHKKSVFEKDTAGAILEIAVNAHSYPNLAPWYIFSYLLYQFMLVIFDW